MNHRRPELTVRIPQKLMVELDGLIPLVEKDLKTATVMGSVSRSSVARLALVEGVEVLRRRYRHSSRNGA